MVNERSEILPPAIVRALIRNVCDVAGSRTLIDDARVELAAAGVIEAVARRNDAIIFDWLLAAVSFQGVSDAVAAGYMEKHGRVSSRDIDAALNRKPSCPKLRGYHRFERCGYRKEARTCNEPVHLHDCPLPLHDLRKGQLNQAAYSLWMFMRDVCGGDFVGWVDHQLARPSHKSFAGIPTAIAVVASPITGPMGHIYGLGWKVLNMASATFLIGSDSERKQWIAAGGNMIAVDTLVHNWIARTGILHSMGAEHPYGDECYRLNGCAHLIERLSRFVDARIYNPDYPKFFPRFVQFAIWKFCAADELNICNGNKIDDTRRCQQHDCDLIDLCARRKLRDGRRTKRNLEPSSPKA